MTPVTTRCDYCNGPGAYHAESDASWYHVVQLCAFCRQCDVSQDAATRTFFERHPRAAATPQGRAYAAAAVATDGKAKGAQEVNS